MPIVSGLMCVSIIVIVLLIKKMKDMKAQFVLDLEAARRKAEAEIAEARENAKQQIREHKEYIETQRTVLMAKDEKTLLVDTILGLGALGERLNGVKEDFVQAITKPLDCFSATADVIVTNAKITCEIKENVDAIKSRVESIESNTSTMYWDSSDIKSKIDSIQSAVDEVKSNANSAY